MNPSPFVPKGPIYADNEDKRRQESRNVLIQAQFVFYTATNWGADQRLAPELLLKLQELAVNQIYRCAGFFRDGPVFLEGGTHKPPPHEQVPELVNAMCAHVNDNWVSSTPLHVAAYLMWRMNWIHPFYGGNGRTARAISYLMLCVKLGFALPGEKTIPEFIAEERTPYYKALRDADAAWETGLLDVSSMESLVSSLLAKQLVQIHEKATGRQPQS